MGTTTTITQIDPLSAALGALGELTAKVKPTLRLAFVGSYDITS
jgi:hypothetical protein